MKAILLIVLGSILTLASTAQQSSNAKEYLIKYEVQTKQGESILVNFLDKDEKNAGATASETWSYSFTTTNKNQNLQIATVGGQTAHRKNGAKVWVKVSIYVNGNVVKSKEEKVLGLGSSVQINLNEIK
jgi:flagella basal body P-ring formation protein FlgA